MKLIYCSECKDLLSLSSEIKFCRCKKFSGRYLDDNVTAVVTTGSIVVGIDNMTLSSAIDNRNKYLNCKDRVDFFFCGWIPTRPGEVIFADDVESFNDKDYERSATSTMPVSL